MPEILVKFADKLVERVVTEKEWISIGRTADNDIVLDNRGVSRKHAQIELSENGALLIDNDSLNGTFVNERKVNEHKLAHDDVITIGKFDLIYLEESPQQKRMSEMDGTMILETKKQSKMIDQDRHDTEAAVAAGGSALIAIDGKDRNAIPLTEETTTFGKASFVSVRIRGFWLPKVQAKIEKDDGGFTLYNLGKSGKTQVNGQIIDKVKLRNGDLIQVGKSVFRFIEG